MNGSLVSPCFNPVQAHLSESREAQDDEVQVFEARVAGHCLFSGTENLKAGVARERSTGHVLKLVSRDARGIRERDFYLALFDGHERPQDCQYGELSLKAKAGLRQLVPQFFGLVTLKGSTFLRLEDISLGGGNVMDVKIGHKTWDRFASKKKIESELSKKAFEGQSFRILGFRVSSFACVMQT